MSDIHHDAHITARCLLVQLLQSEIDSNRLKELSPIHAEEESYHEPHLRGTVWTNPLREDALDNEQTNAAAWTSPVEDESVSQATPPSRRKTSYVNNCTTSQQKRNTVDAYYRSAASSSTTNWWGRWREQLPSLLSSRGSKASTCARSGMPSPINGRAVSSTLNSAGLSSVHVHQWRASIHRTLRQRSSSFEKCLRGMLRAHINATLAAAATSVKAAVLNSDGADVTKHNYCVQTATRSHTGPDEDNVPESTGPLPLPPPDASSGFPSHLRVMSTGYAATICVIGKGQHSADNANKALQSNTSVQDKDTQRNVKSMLATIGTSTQNIQRTNTSTGTKSQKAPLSLQEQLNDCRVQADQFGETRRSLCMGEEAVAYYQYDKLISLLSQLHQVQCKTSSVGNPDAQPFNAPGKTVSSPLEPALSSGNSGLSEYLKAARCAVWEYVPLCSLSAHPASLSVEVVDRTSTSREKRGIVARLKSAWKRRGAFHSGPARTSEESHEELPCSVNETDGVGRSGCKCSNEEKYKFTSSGEREGGCMCLSDPLCPMSDGSVDANQAGIWVTQKVHAEMNKTLLQDNSLTPQLCAYSLVRGPVKNTTSCREQVVISYSLPPRELNGVTWATTANSVNATAVSSAEQSAPTLALHVSWLVCVEVDAVHAAWLHSTLAEVAGISLPCVEDAGADLKQLRTEVLTTLKSFASA